MFFPRSSFAFSLFICTNFFISFLFFIRDFIFNTFCLSTVFSGRFSFVPFFFFFHQASILNLRSMTQGAQSAQSILTLPLGQLLLKQSFTGSTLCTVSSTSISSLRNFSKLDFLSFFTISTFIFLAYSITCFIPRPSVIRVVTSVSVSYDKRSLQPAMSRTPRHTHSLLHSYLTKDGYHSPVYFVLSSRIL